MLFNAETQRTQRKRRAQCHGRARDEGGWATRKCDFDAETRRRGDRRREATRKRERARRQRRNVAFGSARSGYRREKGETTSTEGTGFMHCPVRCAERDKTSELRSDWQAEGRPTCTRRSLMPLRPG